MAANLFLLPFRPALDANAIVVPGAKLYFYATGTTMPQAVYADEALTTPLTNPVEADAAGAWPSIYLDATKVYRCVIKDADGVTLPNGNTDPYVPGVVDALAPEVAANAALAEAYATAIALLATGLFFDTTADGVDPSTGVASGETFLTWTDSRLRLYLNDAGTAVLKAELPTLASNLLAMGHVTSTGSISTAISAVNVAQLIPDGAFNQTGIALDNSDGVMGNNAVFSSQSAVPVFTLTGFSPVVADVYLQGNTDASDYYFSVTNSRGARIRNVYGANTGFGGLNFAPTTDCGVTWLDDIFFEDVTGTGFNIGSRTSKIKAEGVEAFGKIDYTLGLGKPRAGSIGWRQNTPVVGGVAVGGHQIVNSNMEALEKGWWLTDAQLTKLSNCIADGTSDYGLIIDGGSIDIEIADFFCGTSRGIYIGGTSQRILINGLKTLFTGIIPPWGATNFYNGVTTFYDLTVADTAQVTVNGDEWKGGKAVSVASGAKLVVTGGQRVQLNSETSVTAASTVYLKPGGGTTATESEATFRAEFDGVLFMIQADSSATPSSGNHVYTVRKSGADTALTCSTAAGAFQSRAYSGGIAVTRGEVLSVKLVTASGTTAIHDVFVQVLQS